ncbi:MAG: hypothetical protein ACE5IZ_07955 [Dehalococcoidia bacterium]
MQSTEVFESSVISLASSSDARHLHLAIEKHVESLADLLYERLAYSKDELRRYFDSHVEQWRAEFEREQKSALRTFLSNACRQVPLVKFVLSDFRGETVDLLFVVEGDLYEGETQALSIMPRVRRSFPNYYFDVMILPLSAHQSIHKWGTEPEPIYRR